MTVVFPVLGTCYNRASALTNIDLKLFDRVRMLQAHLRWCVGLRCKQHNHQARVNVSDWRAFDRNCTLHSRHPVACVTGPYSVNGVPMRRVNQAYVIATSMSIDVSKVKIPAVDDSYFAREETAKKTDEDQFFEQGAKVRQQRCPQLIPPKELVWFRCTVCLLTTRGLLVNDKHVFAAFFHVVHAAFS